MLLLLLTAVRLSELSRAQTEEMVGNIWTIPSQRSKNSAAHTIALGPWGRSLFASNHQFVFPAVKVDGATNNTLWYKARDRIVSRMATIAGQPVERFTPHDLRRTARSNTKRLKVDFETAEAMLNHLKTGMERIYDGYDLEEEKAAWFLKWEQEIAGIARRIGVAEALGVPLHARPKGSDHLWYLRLRHSPSAMHRIERRSAVEIILECKHATFRPKCTTRPRPGTVRSHAIISPKAIQSAEP